MTVWLKEGRYKHLFHVITFTSALCALIEIAGDFPERVSQMAIFPSTEHEAKTDGSAGLHCKKVPNHYYRREQ